MIHIIDEKDQVVYADSAYVGKEISEHIEAHICEKDYRNNSMTEVQKAHKREKSKIRCRIEHYVLLYHGINARTDGSFHRNRTGELQYRADESHL